MSKKLDQRLDSWKEIARYLGRDVTTAIRWEKTRGLPVHKVPGGKRHSVFAYADEIDAWLGGTAASRRHPVGDSDAGVDSKRRAGWPGVAGVAFLGASVVLLVGISLIWNVDHAAGPPVTVSLETNRLIAKDAAGRISWSYSFPFKLRELTTHQLQEPTLTAGYYAVSDVDGDGSDEAIVSVPADPGDTLYCFSSDGRVLWSRALTDEITFTSERFGPPWLDGQVAVYRAHEGVRIAWSQNHATWWPSIVSVLDARGERLAFFVHSGSIRSLNIMDAPSGALILLGGVNNGRASASLAVLDGERVRGTSPEEPGSRYECRNCTPGRPRFYFLFRPSELNEVYGNPYNQVHGIRVQNGYGVEVYTWEIEEDARAQGVYLFSPDFTLLHANFSDSYRVLHRQWHKEGKGSHSEADCPDFKTKLTVRGWDETRGWFEQRSPIL